MVSLLPTPLIIKVKGTCRPSRWRGGAGVLHILVRVTRHGGPRTLLGMLVGALMIAYTGVIIEKCWPNLSKRLAPLGPACFLVFMLHKPSFRVMRHFLPDSILQSHGMLLLPIPAFVAICAFFLLMKRYTPCLMPYLGHMKLPKKTKAQYVRK